MFSIRFTVTKKKILSNDVDHQWVKKVITLKIFLCGFLISLTEATMPTYIIEYLRVHQPLGFVGSFHLEDQFPVSLSLSFFPSPNVFFAIFKLETSAHFASMGSIAAKLPPEGLNCLQMGWREGDFWTLYWLQVTEN